VFNDAEDFFHTDEWMEDDLVLTSTAAADHDGLKSPPPYSLQSTLTDFGTIVMQWLAALSVLDFSLSLSENFDQSRKFPLSKKAQRKSLFAKLCI